MVAGSRAFTALVFAPLPENGNGAIFVEGDIEVPKAVQGYTAERISSPEHPGELGNLRRVSVENIVVDQLTGRVIAFSILDVAVIQTGIGVARM